MSFATAPAIQGSSGGGIVPGGQSTTLECYFSASFAPVTVVWTYDTDGSTVANSAPQQTTDGSWLAIYTVPIVSVQTAGDYTCRGIDASGTTAQTTITVSVNCKHRLYS